MQLVEQHIIDKTHPCWDEIDAAAFASKNLYNYANYQIRLSFFATGRALSLSMLYAAVKESDAYQSLPRKVSNSILIHPDHRSGTGNPRQRRRINTKRIPKRSWGEPRIPRYKHKTSGRNLLSYDIQAISKKSLKEGIIKPSGLRLTVQTNVIKVDCVRIVPKKTHYLLETLS